MTPTVTPVGLWWNRLPGVVLLILRHLVGIPIWLGAIPVMIQQVDWTADLLQTERQFLASDQAPDFLPALLSSAETHLGDWLLGMVAASILMAAALLYTTIGLWRGTQWGRRLALVVAVADLLGTGLLLLLFGWDAVSPVKIAVVGVVNLAACVYLFFPSVRAQFV